MDEQQAAAWLSEARLASFLHASDGDHSRALSLYAWHVELTTACFGLIHGFEVLVRNAIDAVLGAGQPQTPLNATWLMDFGTLHPWAIKQVVTAAERIERREITRSRVVSGVTFAFWVSLFGRRYEALWRTRMHTAFPHVTEERPDIGERMRAIQRLRNRIAHHDSLLDQDVPARVADVHTIAGWIDPAAPGWLRRTADVEKVLARRPLA